MSQPPSRVPWVVLCPLHGARAELELGVDERGRAVVRECSVKTWSARRPCDQACVAWFGALREDEATPSPGELT